MEQQLTSTFFFILEFLGTFAFAISGIRQAGARNFDWFGAFVCGFVVAIGGGTIRDMMLGVRPFWMTNAVYIICTFLALAFVILFKHWLKPLKNTWFVFDTIGLGLFTIVGFQKAILCGQPCWVGVVMGSITGAAGGVIRDVLLNTEPLIFKEDIYAMACVAGGLVYWLLITLGVNVEITSLITFLFVCLMRFCAIRYNWSLPKLHLHE